uniref:Uncharacterized protein n=1 Tax=Solanum tuberosum TaxID=4113 RepID=M1DK79_SOLTU
MANGKAKMGSPNGSAMRPKYSARNPVTGLRCGTFGTLGGQVNVAQSYWRFIMVLSSHDEHLSIHSSTGQLAILEPLPRRFGESPIWNTARRMEHIFNCSSLLS